MNRFFRLCMGAAVLALIPLNVSAIQESNEIASDSRVRTYIYNPDEVFVFTGHYRYQSSIELNPDETIHEITMGDSTAWQIVPSGSRIFLKPTEQDAVTNMTVITSKRIYLFELHAEEAEDIRDKALVFSARFRYPFDSGGGDSAVRTFSSPDNDIPDTEEDPEKYNFNYTISGSRIIAPLKVFDDGEFTYLEFRDKNADVPAIFLVDERGDESLINYRASGSTIIIERVGQQFTLRHGSDVSCLFNESNPLRRSEDGSEDKFLGIF